MPDPMITISAAKSPTEVCEDVDANFTTRFGMDTRTITASDTLLSTDELVLIDPTAGAVTLTLLAVADCSNRTFYVCPLNVTNTVTLDPAGAETFKDTAATKTIGTARRLVKLWNDGTNWYAWYSDFL